MRLIVAEKPELGRAIAEALGNGRRGDGCIICDDTTVTWCFGHLLELSDPEDHDPGNARWSLAQLPMRWPATHKPIKGKEAQIALIRQLVLDANEIVHAGDPDEEGQLLVDLVLRHVGNHRPVKRVLINDLNPDAIRRAFAKLRDNSEFIGLYRAALGRAVADQRYGYNLTRAYTLVAQRLGGENVLSVGRVQTPILGLVVRRDRARESHEKRIYFELDATFAERAAGTAGSGNNNASGNDNSNDESRHETRALRARYLPDDSLALDEKGRVVDRAALDAIAVAVDGRSARVERAVTEKKSTPPPLPYDLLTLQADASRKFSIAPDRTLAITQSLREKHRLITYNRSDCRYLNEEQHGEAPAVLAAVAATAPALAGAVRHADTALRSRAWNSAHVTAHHAIIPTARQAELSRLSHDEARLYQLIARAFIAQFHPHERYNATRVELNVDVDEKRHRFRATGRRQLEPGWKALYRNDRGNTELGDKDGPAIDIEWVRKGTQLDCSSPEVTERETHPPPAYTMATLLKDLASVARYVTDPHIKALLLAKDNDKKGEHGGIGTPATRSSIIATLLRRDYIEERGKQVLSTTLGRDFHDALPSTATTPDMTALWHEQQDQIRRSETTLTEFLTGVGEFIATEVEHALNAEIRVTTKAPPCPTCQQGVLRERSGTNGKFIGCSRYPDCRYTAEVPGAKRAKRSTARGKVSSGRKRKPSTRKTTAGRKA